MDGPTATPRVGADDGAVRGLVVQRYVSGRVEHRLDRVAAEVPVAIVCNGISHAVMMATPADLEAFGLGFALSEGLVESRDECYGIEVRAEPGGCRVELEIASRRAARLKERRRAFEGRSGCGVCGVESLAQLDLAPPPIEAARRLPPLRSASIRDAFAALPALQRLNAETGAVHAAGWADLDGRLLDAAEDVGRHNALDKLIGRRALAGRLGERGFAIVSSRASYELVRKCARVGIAALAAISAPTTLAIDIASAAGLQLYGFCRGEQAVCYTAEG